MSDCDRDVDEDTEHEEQDDQEEDRQHGVAQWEKDEQDGGQEVDAQVTHGGEVGQVQYGRNDAENVLHECVGQRVHGQGRVEEGQNREQDGEDLEEDGQRDPLG